MATLDVRNYGAVGDGVTDDTAAIQKAIDDAGTGDTILIPATSDYYLVNTSNRAAVDFTSVADDVTITGQGLDSRLRMGDTTDSHNQWVIGAEADTGTISGVTIKQLVLDGNRSKNGRESTIGFNLYPGGGGHDIRIEDVLIENCAGTGLSNRGGSALTLRRVTSRNNGQHGYDFTGVGDGLDTDARSLKSVNNDGVGIDLHNGNHRVEDVYCDSNRSGTKLGASGGAADSVTLRNANLRNARANSGFRETMPDGTTADVTLDTVQVVSPAYDGFRFTNATNYEVTEILAHDGGKSNGYNIRIDDNATVNAQIIRSQYAEDSDGLFNYSDQSSTVSEYYHHANSAPVNDSSGTLTVETQTERESAFLNVPGENDVGAFTGSDSKTEATYQTDFSSDLTGTTPSDWSPRYNSDSSDWQVVTENSPAGNSVLQFDSTESARYALSYERVGSAVDAEILGLFRLDDLSQRVSAGGRLMLRGSGSEGAESGYLFNVRENNFGIWKYVDGSSTRLIEWGTPADNQWYLARFRVEGDRLLARVWPSESSEPDQWDADVQDSSLSSGWVGVGSYSEYVEDWGFVSVGVGSASAPVPKLQATGYSSSAVIKTLGGTIQTE